MNAWSPRVFLALVLGAALPAAAAQAQDGLAFSLDAGVRTMSNSADTEKAIFDSKLGFGAGVGIFKDRGSRWRFGLEARRVAREGERAFAADRTSEAFRLGHPLHFTMIQGVASAAFRFRRIGPVSPYVSLAGGVVSWKEKSDIAGLTEGASGTSGLLEGRLGFERQRGGLRLALEGGMTFIPNAVGVGGISEVYEEKDLGGLFVVLKIGFVRK